MFLRKKTYDNELIQILKRKKIKKESPTLFKHVKYVITIKILYSVYNYLNNYIFAILSYPILAKSQHFIFIDSFDNSINYYKN